MRETFFRFFKFGLIGTLGFVVDSAVLMLCTEMLKLDPYTGRIISYLAAATCTWAGNRFFTFKDRPQASAGKQWGLFVAVNALGFAINYGTYALLLETVEAVRAFPVWGVAAGAIAGMFFNYAASSRLVFRKA